MATPSSRRASDELAREVEELRAKFAEAQAKLAEAQEVIRAIQSGDVDAVVVSGPRGEQIFTLKGAEYSYRVLVEAMNEGAAALAADGTVLYCNQRLSNLLGIPLEQIIGRPVTKLVASDSRSAFEGLFASALAARPGKTEVQLQDRSGREVPVHVSLRDMDADGSTGVCMVVANLTERKQRDELIAAGELARSILESAAEAIAVCDETGRIIAANAGMKQLCGVNPLFQPFDTVLPLDVGTEPAGELARFSIATALAGETQRALEVTLDRRGGEKLWLLLTVGRLASLSWIAGCVVTLTDITEHKQAQEALRESEERFRVLTQNLVTAVALINEHGEFSIVNKAFLRVFNLDERANILNINSRDWSRWRVFDENGRPLDVDEHPVRRARLTRTAVKDKLVAVQSPMRTDLKWLLLSAEPILDGHGSVQQTICTYHDVTARKQAEEALLRSEKLASVGRMAASISHEINNPLAAVMNTLFLARTSADEPESVR